MGREGGGGRTTYVVMGTGGRKEDKDRKKEDREDTRTCEARTAECETGEQSEGLNRARKHCHTTLSKEFASRNIGKSI